MQANRCLSRSPSQKFVISAGDIELAAKASRLDQFELHVPQNGGGQSPKVLRYDPSWSGTENRSAADLRTSEKQAWDWWVRRRNRLAIVGIGCLANHYNAIYYSILKESLRLTLMFDWVTGAPLADTQLLPELLVGISERSVHLRR
jgi:hypothetical protein